MNAGPRAASERRGLGRGHVGTLSKVKGFGKGHSFWMAKVRCESEQVWLGGRSCERQAEPCQEESLSPRHTPCFLSTAKTARVWVCILAAPRRLVLGCPNPPGGSRSQDRDNGDKGVHSCPFPSALLLQGEQRVVCRPEKELLARSGVCLGCNLAGSSPSP